MKPIHLVPGQKYTIYRVSAGAMTVHQEITLATTLPEPAAGRSTHRLGTYKLPRKRGEFPLDVNLSETLIIRGWGHLQADHEAYDMFTCGATINLAGTVEQVQALVAENANPNFTALDLLLAYPTNGEEAIPVYPDSETSHAVVLNARAAA